MDEFLCNQDAGDGFNWRHHDTEVTMNKHLVLVGSLLLLAVVGVVRADDPDWGEQRKNVLMAELKAEIGLSDAQLAAFEILAVAHRQNLIDKYAEVGVILQEIRILRENWEQNFDQIVALQFDIMVKEFERGDLWAQFGAGVDATLTADQLVYKRLVMRVLDDAYRLSPPRHRSDDETEAAAAPSHRQ
jgi:hypothetical protein